MKLNRGERWAVNNPWRPIQQRWEIRWVKKWMSLKPGSVILEVGCGRGAGAGIILKEFQPALLQAMDLDGQMIHLAKKYLSPEQVGKISFYVGDVVRLPYRNGALDAVFGFGVLHHVPDWANALAEISRVLKPGGVFFLEELYPWLYQNFLTRRILLHPAEHRFYSPDLKEALAQNSFALEKFREIKSLGIFGFAVKAR